MMSKKWMVYRLRNAIVSVCWILAFVMWHAIVVLFEFPKYLLPGPLDVLVALKDDAALLLAHALVTTQEWMIGLMLSIVLGALLAVLCFLSKWLRQLVYPLLVVSQSVPYLVFAPLLLLWLGLGMAPKIVLVVLTCSFPIAFVLLDGLERTREEYQIVVGLLRLGPLQAWQHVYRYAGLPYFFSGLKISVAYAYVSAVMAELIGSDEGLGVYMTRAQNSYRTDKVMAAVVLVVLLSIISTALVGVVGKHVVFWKTEKK